MMPDTINMVRHGEYLNPLGLTNAIIRYFITEGWTPTEIHQFLDNMSLQLPGSLNEAQYSDWNKVFGNYYRKQKGVRQ